MGQTRREQDTYLDTNEKNQKQKMVYQTVLEFNLGTIPERAYKLSCSRMMLER